MAFTINGIGTSYYGEREFHPDGSYITTEWFVLLFVPLLPLRSFRVLRVPELDDYYVVYSSKKFITLERLPIHRGQVLAIYGLLLALVAWASLLVWITVILGTPWKQYPAGTTAGIVVLVGFAFVVPMLLRKRTKAGVPFSQEALSATLDRLGIASVQERPAVESAAAKNGDNSGRRAPFRDPNGFDY